VVGDANDLHVRAVAAELERRSCTPQLFDAATLMRDGFTVDLDGVSRATDVAAGAWLRRSAPDNWLLGLASGSTEDACKRSFLRLVASICRLGNVAWLTDVDAMLLAEDRLFQLNAARSMGVRVPRTVVTSSRDELINRLGSTFVVKPIGRGFFVSDQPRAVYATELNASDLDAVDLGAAPFVAQERIRARKHLRVVTVRGSAWCAELDATNWPLDWRKAEDAHRAWRPSTSGIESAAVNLSERLGVGYSSQDWVIDGDAESPVFLDLNPGGQWLFLPEPIAGEVTRAIADFLCSPRGDS
jgi:hypothetical protein